jgi:riboflavin kinase / FMN adenylyltransferase
MFSVLTGNTYRQIDMQQFVNITEVQLPGPSFLTIGNFDGLHRGHQALLRKVIDIAHHAFATGAVKTFPQSGLITFDPHPLTVLRPEIPHFLLTTPAERLALAAEIGIDFGVIQQFTHAVAGLEARDFLVLLKTHLGLAGLVVGPDFAIGRGRKGDLAALRTLGDELGYTLHVIDPVTWTEWPVRSSTIRQAIQQGDVTTAAALLGRYYHVSGEVVYGDQRGRQLGIPTANMQTQPDKLLPANGVYATRTRLQHAGVMRYFNSVTNLGVRPTVDGIQQRLETHILDFPPAESTGDLYGQLLTIEFVARLRDEQRFSSIDKLIVQIQLDIEQARQLFQQEQR